MIRQPEASVKVIEGTNAGSISDLKAGNDGMQAILFQVSS